MPATIATIETIPILYPVRGYFKFFENGAGRPYGRPAVLVRVTASDGTEGWGECVPSPRWSYETLETILTTIEHYLAPELLGRDPLDGERLEEAMNRAIAPSFSTGQPICKAGIDLALFDLTGKLCRQSAAERWGREPEGSVSLSWTLNPRSLAELEEQVSTAHARGYQHFNVKIAPDLPFDLEVLRTLRKLVPEALLWADANGGYCEADALAVAGPLADLGVSFFEQPLPANRLEGYGRLKRLGALPIIMDEGIVSVVELSEFHKLQLLDGVAVKVARAGGLEAARRQIEFLQQNGLIFLGSGLTDPDVSLSASLALFAAYGLEHPAALNGPQFLTASVLRHPFEPRAGCLTPPEGWGLGIEVDLEAVDRLRL
ncbi:MAG: mandelate racemase/muconate lactonizing enzyme family protein [Planctomycetales bacterium]